MKAPRQILLTALCSLAALLLCPACSNSSDEPAWQYCQSIVSFKGNDRGFAWFDYRQTGDSPLITLYTPGSLDTAEVSQGERLLMRYQLPTSANPADGGEVAIISLSRVLTDTVQPIATPPAALSPLYLSSINRAGDYLDIYCQMPATAERSITIEADTSKIASQSMADLYISAQARDLPTTYPTQTVASLWIGPIWNRPDVDSVNVYLNNSNNPYRNKFTFIK